jgi:DNA repair exonuclease SbcCD nuclease subunit
METKTDLLFFGCWGVYCKDISFEKKKEKNSVVKTKKINYLGKTAFESLQKYSKDKIYDAIVIGGDNVYNHPNTLKHDIDLQIKEGFENCISKLPSSTFLLGIGNHDIRDCELLEKEKKYTGIEGKKWVLNNYYSYTDFDKVNLFFIDTNLYQGEYCDKKIQSSPDEIKKMILEQYTWLQKELEQSRDKFNIIIGHIPPISCSHKKDQVMRIEPEILKDLMKLNKLFDLYLCADEHNQQVIKYKEKGVGQINIVVSGSGGAPLDDLYCPKDPNINILYSSITVGGVHIKINKNIVITMIDDKGNIDYELVI